MSSSDSTLDARLQAVPLPDGLLARLRAVAWTDDEGLDAALGEVPVPEDLLKRLHQIPLTDDEGLDATLRSVPVPSRLMASWRRRAKRQDRLLRLSRVAVAASLVIALTLSYFSAMVLSLAMNHWSFYEARQDQKSPGNGQEAVVESLVSSWAAEKLENTAEAAPLASPPEVELARIEERRAAPASTDLGGGLNLPPTADPLLRPTQGVLGYNSFDDLPELPKRVADFVSRGLDWPLVAGSNRAFLIRYGVHPFVSPAAHSSLQTCLVPMSVDTSSYELAQRYLEDGELPPPDLVRTDEFLAAVDYEYPRPDRQDLAVTAAAGPSPFGEGLCLLQIGVQARQTLSESHMPNQLVLLVDTSASMRWGSRIEILRRALKDLVGRVDPSDRLSLVSFNQGAHVLVQDVGPREVGHFVAAVDSLSAEGSTDMAAGIREAYGLAQQLAAPGQPPVRVVLLTDGLLELERSAADQIEHQVAEAAGRGIPLQVIDLGQQKEGDPQVAAFARAGHGTVQRATNVDQVRWALREILTGRSQLVARDTQLKVTFNPKTVLEYRLLGHEAKEWAGMMAGSTLADFRDGQAATALYELRLAGTGPTEVANVELSWYPPGGIKPEPDKGAQRLIARVERKDFATTWSRMAPSLQEAALVAQAAEILRRSPFVFARPQRVTTFTALLRVSDLAGQVDSRLLQRPSFVDFVSLVEQATRAKPTRSGARRP